MRKPTGYDWLGAIALWAGAAGAFGAYLHLGTGMHEEVATGVGFGVFFAGLGIARFWWLRRADPEPGAPLPEGMSTGEMTAQRLAELEARLLELEAAQERVFELEERLELAERLLAQGRDPARLLRERTPV